MGRLLGLDVEALQQGLGAGIGVGIQRPVRMAVAPEEILQPQHVAAARRPDQDGTGLARLQQPDTAQDQARA